MDTTTPLPPALQRVQQLQKEGYSERQMAEILDAEGAPLSPRRKKWTRAGVRAALQQLATLAPAPAPPSPPSITAVPAPRAVDPPSTPSPPELAPQPPAPARVDVKIQGPWIETDSRLWEFLLHKVWEELTTKTDHTLPLDEALEGLRLTYRRRDRAHLAEALDRLAASHVKLELQLADQRISVNTPLLSSVLKAQSLSFQFPTALIKLVRNPQQYIRLTELLGAAP